MNLVILIGRLTKDIEVKYTSGAEPLAVTNFNLAIDRPKRKGQDKADTDFIPVTVWGKQAENCEKYLHKGQKVAIHGRIQRDIKEDDYGNKKEYTKVIASNVEFVEYAQKNDTASADSPRQAPQEDNVPDSFQMIDEDVPF